MNIAIIGCGTSGTIHAQIAAQSGHTIVACVDTAAERAEALASKFTARSSAEPLEVIRDDTVDAVAITSPLPSHMEYILCAIDAGKHVFCEAPLAQTVDDALGILDAA